MQAGGANKSESFEEREDFGGAAQQRLVLLGRHPDGVQSCAPVRGIADRRLRMEVVSCLFEQANGSFDMGEFTFDFVISVHVRTSAGWWCMVDSRCPLRIDLTQAIHDILFI